MEDAFSHSVQIAIRPPQIFQSHRDGILDVLVLAAATFEEQANLHFLIVLPLLEVDDGSPVSEIVAAVFPGE
jgi:hypothetical protein